MAKTFSPLVSPTISAVTKCLVTVGAPTNVSFSFITSRRSKLKVFLSSCSKSLLRRRLLQQGIACHQLLLQLSYRSVYRFCRNFFCLLENLIIEGVLNNKELSELLKYPVIKAVGAVRVGGV